MNPLLYTGHAAGPGINREEGIGLFAKLSIVAYVFCKIEIA